LGIRPPSILATFPIILIDNWRSASLAGNS
jgi:hypothetical protein